MQANVGITSNHLQNSPAHGTCTGTCQQATLFASAGETNAEVSGNQTLWRWSATVEPDALIFHCEMKVYLGCSTVSARSALSWAIENAEEFVGWHLESIRFAPCVSNWVTRNFQFRYWTNQNRVSLCLLRLSWWTVKWWC